MLSCVFGYTVAYFTKDLIFMAKAQLDPEDEGAMIFRNAGNYSQKTQREFSENFNPQLHLCEHLKSRMKCISP
jgi:hypothetical protein